MKGIRTLFLACLIFASTQPLPANVNVGDAAPDFAIADNHDAIKKLSDYKGQIVILEWHNPQCAYVSKFYKKGTLQKLQQQYTRAKIIWLMINSNAPGERGYMDSKAATAYLLENDATPTAYLIDADGSAGKLYGAHVTPTVFIINEAGNVIYKGAIDDRLTTDPNEVAKGRNYIKAAIRKAVHKKSVAIPETKPYGCDIKYKNIEE